MAPLGFSSRLFAALRFCGERAQGPVSDQILLESPMGLRSPAEAAR